MKKEKISQIEKIIHKKAKKRFLELLERGHNLPDGFSRITKKRLELLINKRDKKTRKIHNKCYKIAKNAINKRAEEDFFYDITENQINKLKE